jgi:hypothetical protein
MLIAVEGRTSLQWKAQAVRYTNRMQMAMIYWEVIKKI